MRNVVTRRLDDGPVADAMGKINEDLVTFADMARLQTAPTEEIILRSAPWES
ncbi:MAG: hypothetical protein OSA99_15335 [Acidimicrobiales bacterium]|nr:hypothetical protein [Acidimicrobiales bacterium]